MRLLKEIVVNPGRVARRWPAAQKAYKTVSNIVMRRRRQRLRMLGAGLPVPRSDLAVSRQTGLRVVPPGTLPSAAQLTAQCQALLQRRTIRVSRKVQLRSLLTPHEVAAIPEFMEFLLDPVLLGVASEYLGELPIIGAVELWCSQPVPAQYSNSQLYHLDLDDVQQLKVFLFVSDVALNCGPLTVLPADVSARVSRAIGYRPSAGHLRLADDQVHPLLLPGEEMVLTGPRGTMVFVDTSRALHFGSRVTGRERYVVMVQYLGLTNYMHNPFFGSNSWPFAFAAKPHHTAMQRAVLGHVRV